MKTKSKLDNLYQKQLERHNELSKNKNKLWRDKNTTDYWRHKRMYRQIKPLTNKKTTWLTIGDGKYGRDAEYLSQYAKKVLATDIATESLNKAKQDGFIEDYQKQNAEKLTFLDNEYDYVLCKETYHHLPRPIIALYEMLRVAKKAVVLIEPRDIKTIDSPIARIKSFLNLIETTPSNHLTNFEEVGNYVYALSLRQIEKISTGLNLPMLAYKEFDDYYISGSEQEGLDESSTPIKNRIELQLKIMKFLRKLGLRKSNLLAIVIFKEKPSKKQKQQLKKIGYKFYEIPENPYKS